MKKILILILIALLSFNVVSENSNNSQKEENEALDGIEDIGEGIKYIPIE